METVEPELEPKINNFGSATLVATSKSDHKKFKADQKKFLVAKFLEITQNIREIFLTIYLQKCTVGIKRWLLKVKIVIPRMLLTRATGRSLSVLGPEPEPAH